MGLKYTFPFDNKAFVMILNSQNNNFSYDFNYEGVYRRGNRWEISGDKTKPYIMAGNILALTKNEFEKLRVISPKPYTSVNLIDRDGCFTEIIYCSYDTDSCITRSWRRGGSNNTRPIKKSLEFWLKMKEVILDSSQTPLALKNNLELISNVDLY
ncbi:MAG: hypothetical protein KC550_02300 [Nanoarchaeota archaeon]|nr:hypothetical protein [Nanoarchaeota archaeon]